METKTGLFTDILPSGAGFVTFSDGRQAFVLPSLIRTVELQLGDEVECRLAPNFADKSTDRVPWRVLHVSISKRAAGSMAIGRGMEDVLTSCYSFLETRGGAWTADEIAEELGSIDTRFVARALLLLLSRDRVCEAAIRVGAKDRDPELFYAIELESLLPVGALDDDEEEMD